MKYLNLITVVILCVLAVGLFVFFSCSDSELDDVDPPTNNTPDDSERDSCNIDDSGLEELPLAKIECLDLLTDGDFLKSTGIYGTSNIVSDGERFKLTFDYDVTNAGVTGFEPIAGCPLGSNYAKCSYKAENDQLQGSFELMLNVKDCPEVTDDNEIKVRVVFGSNSFVYDEFCVIYLDGNTSADDDDDDDDLSDDDDTTDDDDDSTDDDDTTDDDTTDDDTTDDDDDIVDDDDDSVD